MTTTRNPTWGEQVVEGRYAGHPGLLYNSSPTSLLELLHSTHSWEDRDYLVQGQRRVRHPAFRAAVPAAAEQLVAAGVRRGDRVMLHSYNCLEFVLATWATWWVGAVPVYANRWWSSTEIHHALQLTAPALVLSDAAHLVHAKCPVMEMTTLSEAWNGQPAGQQPAGDVTLGLTGPVFARMIQNSPVLTSRGLEVSDLRERALGDAIAAETGADTVEQRIVAAQLASVHRVLFAEGARRSLAGQPRDDIREVLAAAASRAFDLLEPSLGGYGIRPR